MNVSVSQLRGFRTILFYTGTKLPLVCLFVVFRFRTILFYTGTKQFAALTRLFYTIKERKESNEEIKS